MKLDLALFKSLENLSRFQAFPNGFRHQKLEFLFDYTCKNKVLVTVSSFTYFYLTFKKVKIELKRYGQ